MSDTLMTGMSDTRVKIIGTIGPACSDIDGIRSMVKSGMRVARINFSHDGHDDQRKRIELIKRVRKEEGVNVGIMQDLAGPKIRLGNFSGAGLSVDVGGHVTLITDPHMIPKMESFELPLPRPPLPENVPAGTNILIDDGLIELELERSRNGALECRVTQGGIIKPRKGVSFPGLLLALVVPTDKDNVDLLFGIENEVDMVAQSFVQTAEDINQLKQILAEAGSKAAVIAKLETKLALKNLDSILEASDGVMVARGDLGVETDLSMIPVHQKTIVRKAIAQGKLVVVATQMLESMTHSAKPTRAEATDVANAVYDGVDAIMLSGETAVGKHPAKVIDMASMIARNVENNLGLDHVLSIRNTDASADAYEMAVARSVCVAARQIEAVCIVAHTLSGKTARLIAQNRPLQPIVAITPVPDTYYLLSLVWGTTGLLVPDFEKSFIDTIRKGDQALLASGLARKGDTVVVTAGIPEGQSGGTNAMKVHRVGQ